MQRQIQHFISSFVFLIAIGTLLISAGYQEFDLDIHNSTLTMSAERVPLKKVLHEFEKQTGIKIRFLLPISDLVTVDFTDIPIDKAINLLLRNFDHSLSYSRSQNRLDHFVSEIYVSERTANNSAPLKWTPAASNRIEQSVASTLQP